MMTDFTKKIRFPALLRPTAGIHGKIMLSAAFLLLSFLSNPLFASISSLEKVNVIVPNQPPVAGTDLLTTDEDTPVSGNVLENDHDPEGGVLHVVAETITTSHGEAVIHADGTVTYTPNPNYYGQDSFTYGVCDNASPNGCCTGTVKITILSKPDAPVGNPDLFSVNEDTPLVTTPNSVLGNDVDPDGGPITAVLGKPTKHGNLVLNPNGTFTYNPDLNFNGTDTFTYYANDGTGNSNETLVTITVIPVNDPPIAVNDVIATNEDMAVTIPVLANDTDVDDVLVVSMIIVVSQPAQGTLVINQTTKKVIYTPKLNYNGNDSFTYKLKDSGNAFSNVATVTITVNPVNDAPIAVPELFSVNEDTPLVTTPNSVLGNDVDPDGGPITAVLGKPTKHGSLVLNPNGTFTYNPDLNFNGTDTFTYYANDGTGNSDETLVTITVIPVNDPPIAVNDVIATNEDMAVTIPVLANDTDVDDVLVVSMIIVVSQPAQGTLVINQTTKKVIYTPKLNYNGNDSFTYKLKDSGDAFSNVATVTITVNPVNDAPIAVPDLATTPEDVPISIPVLSNDTDADNTLNPGSVVLTVVGTPSHGSAVVQPSTGAILYTPAKDFFGTDSFTYTVKDAGGATSAPGTVTITVTPVNDAPVAVDDAATTDENTPVGIPVLVNDFDVDDAVVPASITITTNPQHGTLSINTSTGVVTYSPKTDFVGNDSFLYTIRDPGGLVSLPATVSISVIDVNLPPIAVDDAITHNSLLPVTIDVLANDYDPDNAHDELSIVSATNPSVGRVSIVNGAIVYTPEGTISTTETFTYTITDPGGLTDEAVVTIAYEYIALLVSQGFSPNGDGNNETWYIQGIEYYPNNIVKVYDRWGLLVFQKAGYENTISPWNGRGNTGQMDGKLVERGTYYYILEPGGGLKTLTGYVVVIR